MNTPTATEPGLELKGRIIALQSVAEMLHDDLSAYAKQLPDDDVNATQLKAAIDAHVAATGEFSKSALACVPPTGR